MNKNTCAESPEKYCGGRRGGVVVDRIYKFMVYRYHITVPNSERWNVRLSSMKTNLISVGFLNNSPDDYCCGVEK